VFRRGTSRPTPQALDEWLAQLDGLDDAGFAHVVDRVLRGPLARRHRSIFWGDRLLSLDKSAGFLDDARLAAACDAIAGSHVYDQYGGADSIRWRLHTLVWAGRRGLALHGDFVECGVFNGDMSWVVTEVLDFARQPKTFYLYDTFAGFSSAHSTPEDFPDNPEFLRFADAIYNDERIYPAVVARFAHVPNVQIVRGVVPESLAGASPDAIAYLHLDLNSPAAETGALETLYDRVTPGAAIVLDDYGWREHRQQKAAADRFFASRGCEVLELPTGQGLVVRNASGR
jgi:hypothetical protein